MITLEMRHNKAHTLAAITKNSCTYQTVFWGSIIGTCGLVFGSPEIQSFHYDPLFNVERKFPPE